MFERLNDGALDGYLRGEHGELLRRMALEEFARRSGTGSVRVTLGVLAEILRQHGWVAFPRSRGDHENTVVTIEEA